MKVSSLFCLVVACLLMISCGTVRPNYLGTTYPATQTIDSYYAAKDVKHSYKVIGHFAVKSPELQGYMERAKKDIIEEAKKQGADGLIFSSIDYDDKSSAMITIKADAIKYDK
ncbi:MAG: hypothetical protein WC615_16930 [Mucilaginibacter sp.]|jgi:hypothetical protein|uniref:hypothetical protein n=1 Tax=Mucilaginibacter sp. TaxID=1882438 RepID=UPI003562878A